MSEKHEVVKNPELRAGPVRFSGENAGEIFLDGEPVGMWDINRRKEDSFAVILKQYTSNNEDFAVTVPS